ncbi:MAG: DUF4403 family protein, partial [Bacteroidota bacterium]|nr:DUF4403 family protein [Bacteroidota bacterium]
MKITLLRFILLGTLLSTFLLSFSTNKYISPKEKEVGIDTVGIQSRPSSISIPMEIDIQEIESMINNRLKGEIYTDNSFENNNTDNLMLRVWKMDNFSITVENNEL